MITSGINLVMTVIGFSVSTMFIVFVCTRLVCARIHLNTSRRSFPIASRPDLSALERGLHGLEPVVVAKFPMKKYSDAYFSAVKDSQCTICLADYHGEDLLRILPYCAHSFHVSCIDIWLVQHSTCPVCRISQREAPEVKRLMHHPLFSSAVRSHFGTESDVRSYRFLLTRTLENHPPNRIREDDCESGINEAGGRVNSLSIPQENLVWKESETKNVESPSNA